jgi:hypothetical protein
MSCREYQGGVSSFSNLTSSRIKIQYLFNFISLESNAHGTILIDTTELYGVPAGSELPPGKGDIVSLIEHINEFSENYVSLDCLAFGQSEGCFQILNGRPYAVQAGDTRYHNNVRPGKKRLSC